MLRRILIILAVTLLTGIIIVFVVVRQIVFGGTPTIHPRHAPPLAASPCATFSSFAGLRAFRVVPQDSTASYEASFLAAGQTLPGSVMGITGDVSGEFLLTSDTQPVVKSLKIVVDLRSLDSGSPERDDHVRNDTLEVDKYPYTIFSIDKAQILPGSYSEGQTATFKLKGEMTLHGITRPETFDMQATLVNNIITGTANTLIHLQDFKMRPPQTTSVVTVTVGNAITLMVNFSAKRDNCANVA
jgi:polyisoprenoid-binding protein YceI